MPTPVTPPKVVETDRTITLIGKNGRAHARMIRLSPTYVAIISPRGAKPGTHLEVEFELPAFGKFHTLRLPVTVTERHSTGESFHLTLKFETIPAEALRIIEEFIAYKQRLHEANLHFVAPVID